MKIILAAIAVAALAVPAIASATPSATQGSSVYWMSAKEANALLYEAPVYLPGYGQFQLRDSGRCIAYGPFKKDARKRTLWRYFRCVGSYESLAQPGQKWTLIFYCHAWTLRIARPPGRSSGLLLPLADLLNALTPEVEEWMSRAQRR